MNHHYSKDILGNGHCSIGWFDTLVWARDKDEALKRAKEKWVIDNERNRKAGKKIHYLEYSNEDYKGHYKTQIIPKVEKNKMRIEDYRIWKERGKKMWYED
ncbi:hypothetical protein CMI40_02680 [Candidatus Pacearchaeota archaeon]|nr:hypothetical protein [Candidatus Pacearchaeota archaeon]